MYLLAEQYRYGRGVPANLEQAMQWYGRAANNKQRKAAFLYAVGLKNGESVPANEQQAYVWMSIAALLHHPEAPQARELIGRFLSSEQKQQAWQEVARLQQELGIPQGW